MHILSWKKAVWKACRFTQGFFFQTASPPPLSLREVSQDKDFTSWCGKQRKSGRGRRRAVDPAPLSSVNGTHEKLGTSCYFAWEAFAAAKGGGKKRGEGEEKKKKTPEVSHSSFRNCSQHASCSFGVVNKKKTLFKKITFLVVVTRRMGGRRRRRRRRRRSWEARQGKGRARFARSWNAVHPIPKNSTKSRDKHPPGSRVAPDLNSFPKKKKKTHGGLLMSH